ncbi:hypothetical protein SAMN05660199_03824 [Klenkia soli]|uniref:ABC-type Mn/Zn transport systems, ATPase component n=1 Tax=Klenkia soli TaxID=1052260 RepID=A0A1H0SGT7_9ACTN|nr:hypothetical protein [Klenkia soli]SDP40739.1 hypothetical protein SAMN05660199_03824 [Klenkia soli]
MTADRHTVLRSMHDIGLAAWFGGSLMGAFGVNGAAAAAKDPTERVRLSSIGWAKWAPVQAAAIGVHLVGSLGMARADRGRVANQDGAVSNTVIKTVLTAAAMGTTLASGLAGAKTAKGAKDASGAPAAGATEPGSDTPADVAEGQAALKPLQWINPVLTSVLIVLAAQQGEQQRTAPALLTGMFGQGITGARTALKRAAG